MKRTLCALLSLALLFAACAMAETLCVSSADPGDRLNLRAAPRQSAVSLGKYYSGTPVTVLGPAQNGYVPVSIGGYEGYMDERYLSAQALYACPTLRVNNASGTGANVRAKPDSGAQIVYFASNGETLSVLAVRDDGWLHVRSEGITGFCRAQLLDGELSYHSGDYAEKTNTGAETDAPLLPGQISPQRSYVYQVGNPYDQSAAPAVRVMSRTLAVVSNPDPKDRLNLRSEPSSSAPIVAKYYSGTVVSLEGTGDNGWIRVCVSGSVYGYMQTRYLVLDESPVPSAMLSRTVSNPGGTGANLRSAPSSSSEALAFCPNGETVTVFGVHESGWCHVLYRGYAGFVQAGMLGDMNGLTFDAPR